MRFAVVMHRLKILAGHLSPPGAAAGGTRDVGAAECGSAGGSGPQDVVVVHGRRTAIGKAKRGAFKVTNEPAAGSPARGEGRKY